MKKITTVRNLLCAALVAASTTLFAQDTVTTDPVGFVSADIVSGFNAVGITMVNTPSFTGVASTASTDEVVLNAAPTLVSGTPYYLEVLSGSTVGERFDVASWSGATVTLDVSETSFSTLDDASAIEGEQVVIRAHFTLGDIADAVGDNAQQSNSLATGDQVLVWSGGSFLRHLFTPSGLRRYYGDFSVASDVVIAPGSGFFLLRNPSGASSGSSYKLRVLGAVRTNNYVMDLAGGYQLITTGYPVDDSPSSLGLSGDGFVASNNVAVGDVILEWNGNSLDRYLLTSGGWRKYFGDFGFVDSTQLFAPNKALFIRTQNSIALEVSSPLN